jgi:ankyrin repeat protein
VNAKDRDLWTPLHAAGRQIVFFYKNQKFNFLCLNNEFNFFVSLLATCGHTQICKILIENGAELLALNADGNMPYDICDDDRTLDYIETQMDRIGITQEMIDNTRSRTESQMLFDLQLLVKRSGSSLRSIDDILSYRNADSATPLHIASANGYQAVVEYLLQQHVSINLQDADGWTPIHAAAFWCQQPTLSRKFMKENKS